MPDPSPPPPSQSAPVFRPVFVVGCPRSGTTLLTTILDRHPSLAGTPETYVFHDMPPQRLEETESHDALLDHAFRIRQGVGWVTRIGDLGVPPDQARRRFSSYPATYSYLVRSVLELFAEAQGKARVVEKTPTHLEWVDLILEWYPDARVVCATRNGPDTVASLLRAPFTSRGYIWQSLKWRRYALMADDLRRRHTHRFRVQRLEDLLADPESEMERLLGWLGEAFDPRVLDPASSSGVVKDQEKTWKSKALLKPDPSLTTGSEETTSTWRSAVMDGIMEGALEPLGYERSTQRGSLRIAVARLFGWCLRPLAGSQAIWLSRQAGRIIGLLRRPRSPV